MGIVGIIPPSVFLAWGIARSSSAKAAILSLTIPIPITVLAVWLVGERLTKIRLSSLLLALFGTVLISAKDLTDTSFQARLLAGNLVIFLACAGSAFYNAYGKRLLRFSELEVLVYGLSGGRAGLRNHRGMLRPTTFIRLAASAPSVWLSIGVLGGLPWGLAMILWMWVLSRIDASQASVSIYLLSVFEIILSAITLHERLSTLQLLGGSLVVLGTVWTSEYESRKLARSQQAIS